MEMSRGWVYFLGRVLVFVLGIGHKCRPQSKQVSDPLFPSVGLVKCCGNASMSFESRFQSVIELITKICFSAGK
jgi:hypothetical protein